MYVMFCRRQVICVLRIFCVLPCRPNKWTQKWDFGLILAFFSISAAIFWPFQAWGHFPFSFPFFRDFCSGPVSHSVNGWPLQSQSYSRGSIQRSGKNIIHLRGKCGRRDQNCTHNMSADPNTQGSSPNSIAWVVLGGLNESYSSNRIARSSNPCFFGKETRDIPKKKQGFFSSRNP